jgi:phosphatidylinositol N-acetylglucosaminyltransferase subunit A
MYDWERVTERTEKVYDEIMERDPIDLWTRMHRSVLPREDRTILMRAVSSPIRTLRLGPFAGIIYFFILTVECLFFLCLEWAFPREDIHYVQEDWKMDRFAEVCYGNIVSVILLY